MSSVIRMVAYVNENLRLSFNFDVIMRVIDTISFTERKIYKMQNWRANKSKHHYHFIKVAQISNPVVQLWCRNVAFEILITLNPE